MTSKAKFKLITVFTCNKTKDITSSAHSLSFPVHSLLIPRSLPFHHSLSPFPRVLFLSQLPVPCFKDSQTRVPEQTGHDYYYISNCISISVNGKILHLYDTRVKLSCSLTMPQKTKFWYRASSYFKFAMRSAHVVFDDVISSKKNKSSESSQFLRIFLYNS